MSSVPRTPAEWVAQLRAQLASMPAGVSSVSSPDGRSVAFSRRELLEELRYWESEARKASGMATGGYFESPLRPR